MQQGLTKLVGTEVVNCSLEEWGRFFNSPERHLAKDLVGEHFVSTVFLGMDHSFLDGPPLWFETMVFCQKEHHNCQWDDECRRYSTHAEALAGHQKIIKELKAT